MNRIPDAELDEMEQRLCTGEDDGLCQGDCHRTARAVIAAPREAYEEIGLLLARTSTPATTLPSVTTTNADEWICPICWCVIVPGVPHLCVQRKE